MLRDAHAVPHGLSNPSPSTEESVPLFGQVARVSWPVAGSSPVSFFGVWHSRRLLASSLSPADKQLVDGWRSNMPRDPQSAASLRALQGSSLPTCAGVLSG